MCSKPQTFPELAHRILLEVSYLQALQTQIGKVRESTEQNCDTVYRIAVMPGQRAGKAKVTTWESNWRRAELPTVGTKGSGCTVAGSRAIEAKNQKY